MKGYGKAGRWLSPLTHHVLPKLGKVPITEIDQRDIANVLKPHWHVRADTARKALNRMGIVLRHAAAMGLDVDLQATEKARALLGKSRHVAKNIPAMAWCDVPTFYGSLSKAAELDPALAILEDADILRYVDRPQQSRGGRPLRLFLVNPAIHA